MGADELGHGEGADAVLTENLNERGTNVKTSLKNEKKNIQQIGCVMKSVNHLMFSSHLSHLLVGEEVLLVLRVLQVVLLEVGPQLLDALGPRKERIRLIK